MAGLTLKELNKRNNLELFYQKVCSGDTFSLTKTASKNLKIKDVIVYKDNIFLLFLQSFVIGRPNILHNFFIKGTKFLVPVLVKEEQIWIPSGWLQKTTDFGSSPLKEVYWRENNEISHIRRGLAKYTNNNTKPIDINFACTSGSTVTIKNVVSIKTAKELPGVKADFCFLDSEKNIVAKISHKSGKTCTSFQQWSGIKCFKSHPEILSFATDLKQHLMDTTSFPDKMCIAREINDKHLKQAALFGTEDDSVDFVIQGLSYFNLTKTGDLFLKSHLILSKEEDIDLLPKSYQPIILAKKGLQRNSFNIPNCRGVLYPKNGRKVHVWI